MRGEGKVASRSLTAGLYETKLLQAVRAQFELQRTQVITNAALTNLTRSYKLKDGSSEPTKQDKRQYLNSLLDWTVASAALSAAISPILLELIVATGAEATMTAGGQPSAFNAQLPAILDYNQQRSDKIATDVDAETEKQLRASISEGMDGGEDDQQLQARIELIMGAALTYRADRIARTEVTRGQGWADIEAWKQLGTVTGKEWYTAQDERVCPFCNSLDGSIVALDSDYYSLGDVIDIDGKTLNISYEDVGSPPLHVGCRCQLMDVTVPLSDLGAA